MRCSLVVRAYNEEEHIGRLLEGVRHQTVQDVEVILVDSGSTDATAAIAARYGAKVVHIDPAEFTFGRSLNLGLASASHELTAIASAHVYPVYPDWLERLLEPFTDPKVALAYGRQRGDAHSKFSEHQIFSRWYPDQPDPAQKHPFCNNANAVIRRSVWDAFPYDETLTGLEDLAWAKRVQEKGYNIAYVPTAEVVHVHAETSRGVFNRYQREGMAFKRLYPEAHFNLYDFSRNTLASIGFDLLHAARLKIFFRSLFSIFWFRTAQFWGTYQGYRHSSTLTPELRQTFYYHVGWEKDHPARRDVEPIRYNE
ncbi:MAG TPA: glycosyltransferase family A protein [Anaerolineales bacterium]|nr:glycosyltransferase family A protein [Anaerolineales bacterium]